MADRICVDTDVLIGLLRKDPASVSWFSRFEGKAILATTQINGFEMYCGAFYSIRREENLQAAEKLLQKMIMLNLTHESTRHAGEWFAKLKKKGHSIEMRDLLIGAIALTEGFRLKTYNRKHFEQMEGLILED